MGGQIVDASIAEAPKQHDTRREKMDIKAGRTPEGWKDKQQQKDMDACWTLKRRRGCSFLSSSAGTMSALTDFMTSSAGVTDAAAHGCEQG